MRKTKIKNIIRALLIIIGIVLLLLFIAPIHFKIVNIGNIIGITLSAAMIIAGLFWNLFTKLIYRLREKKAGKVLLSIVFGVAIIGFSCFFAALGSTFAYSYTNADTQDTIIVLGCAVNRNKASLMLNQRINAAYKYLSENENSVAVLSGGQGPGEDISEAQCMYEVLTEKGIDGSRLYLEDKSTNTLENITFSKELIEKNNLSDNIAICSADFHLKRATMVAKKQGITAKHIASRTSLFLAPTYYVRDACGVIMEFLSK